MLDHEIQHQQIVLALSSRHQVLESDIDTLHCCGDSLSRAIADVEIEAEEGLALITEEAAESEVSNTTHGIWNTNLCCIL